uniref:Polyketide_cyc domain-containing protein n=1 Tax=Panagrellus redivivus TaxID=6233 RepID=A0A7E4V7Y2_PANRE
MSPLAGISVNAARGRLLFSAASKTRFNQVSISQRQLFDFLTGDKSDRTMEYAEKRPIGFSAEQMFDVVNTVAEYPEFVPYCKKVDIRKLSDSVLEADLQIGFPPLHERYSSKVTSLRPFVVRSVCTDGRLFNVLDTTWRFQPSDTDPRCCLLYYSLQFEFKSALHAKIANAFFNHIVRTMVKAFLKRAEKLHGPPAISYDKMVPEVIAYKG